MNLLCQGIAAADTRASGSLNLESIARKECQRIHAQAGPGKDRLAQGLLIQRR
jgi:hypothetical protein